MSCNSNQFPTFPFFVPHTKPHGSRGSRKKYYLRLDPKLGQGKFIILRIPCECVTCKSILYKPFNPGVSN